MAWVRKGSLRGPQGLGVVDLLANRLYSGSLAAGASATVANVHTKTMLGARVAGYGGILVGYVVDGRAYLTGQGRSTKGVKCDLSCDLVVSSNSVKVVETSACPVPTYDGFDYGGGQRLPSPTVYAIYGI